MNKFPLFTFSFFVPLLEVAFLPLPLSVVFVVLLSLYGSLRFSLLVAFLTGVILDLLSVQTVGTASIMFLATAFAIILYKRRFRHGNVFFVFFALFFGILVHELIRGDFFLTTTVLSLALVSSLVVSILWIVLSIFLRREGYEAWTKFS